MGKTETQSTAAPVINSETAEIVSDTAIVPLIPRDTGSVGEKSSKERPQFSVMEENRTNNGEKCSGKCSDSREYQPECDFDPHEALQDELPSKFEMKKASFTESLDPDNEESIVDFQRRTLLKERATNIVSSAERKLLHCPLCGCFYVSPITLFCGHTLCKTCILPDNVDQNSVIDCKQCGIRNHTTELAVNVLLTRLIQKWFPIEYESEVKKLEDVQRRRLQQGEQRKVVETLSEVLHNSPCNLTALKWRSHALYQMGMFKQALRDAELACVLRPFLPVGFYQRGLILVAMENHEQAALSFAHCLVLDATNSAEYHLQLLSCLTKLFSSDSDTFGKAEGLDLECCDDSRTTENTCKRSKFASNNEWESRDESTGDILAKESRKSTNSDSSSSIRSARPVIRKPLFSEKQSALKRPLEESTPLPIPTSRSKCTKVAEHEAGTRSHMQESTARNIDDLTCEICYSVLFRPVTTSCGHTFCRECLQRSLDFKPECPYCRMSLNCIIARYCQLNIVVKEITEKLFPEDFAARERSFANEKARWRGCGVDDDVDVPIFVCMLAFPSLNYPLHIFEPRYRLMIRRCVELGSRMFGMCANHPDVGFSEYGTILYIDTIDVLPDGRCIIQTTARRRFRVISRSVSVDGYNTAKVQWLQDETPNLYAELAELEALNFECSTLLVLWFYSLTQLQQTCIINAIGSIPRFDENLVSSPYGPSWVWWALAAIPLQDSAKLIILAMTSLEERLKSIRRFLEILVTMNSNSGINRAEH